MSSAENFMNYRPPTFDNVAPQSGGTSKSLLSGVSSMLTGPGGIAGSLFSSALGGLSASSSASSDAQGGNVATTGWGTFNSPFNLSTGGSKLDSRNEQTAPTSMDLAQTGPTGGARAPLLSSGDGFNGLSTILILGVVGLVVIKVMKKKGA